MISRQKKKEFSLFFTTLYLANSISIQTQKLSTIKPKEELSSKTPYPKNIKLGKIKFIKLKIKKEHINPSKGTHIPATPVFTLKQEAAPIKINFIISLINQKT